MVETPAGLAGDPPAALGTVSSPCVVLTKAIIEKDVVGLQATRASLPAHVPFIPSVSPSSCCSLYMDFFFPVGKCSIFEGSRDYHCEASFSAFTTK